jgi:hypothetical protein
MSIDTVNPEATEPQTPAVEAPEAPAGDSSGGTQPASEEVTTTPAQDEKPGSEPTVPISRLNEVIRERNELRLFRQQLEAARNPQPQQPQGPPKQEDFSDFDAYQKAVISHEVQQGIQAFKQQEQQQAYARQQQERAQKADMNFTKKLNEAVAKDPHVIALLESAPSLRPDLQVNLKEFSDPIGLGKHLAMNPDLVWEMNNLPPDLAVQRMWGIGQSLAGSTTPPKPSVSKAPPPISPVGSGKTSTSGGYRDDMSQEEFQREFKPIW